MSKQIYEYKAPDKLENFSDRPNDVKVDTIVIHYTVSDLRSSYYTFIEPIGNRNGVSIHYLIDRDGTVMNLVPHEKMAWHAGLSSWGGKDKVNDFSIGISLVNTGSGHVISNNKLTDDKSQKDLFPEAQMTALSEVIGVLKSTLEIKNQNIIGHSDITAYEARHVNPGTLFDWQSLAVDGHGLYPQCDVSSITPAALYSYGSNDPKITTLQSHLKTYGYKIDLTGFFDDQTRNVVRAFNMHFHNDINYDGFEYESWDNISDARLDDLLQQMQHESHTMMQEL